jgi:hypothetical protein
MFNINDHDLTVFIQQYVFIQFMMIDHDTYHHVLLFFLCVDKYQKKSLPILEYDDKSFIYIYTDKIESNHLYYICSIIYQ